MAETSSANSGAAKRIRSDVENNIVGTRRITRDSAYSGEMIKSEIVAHAPRNMWSAHEVSPLTPTPPIMTLPGP